MSDGKITIYGELESGVYNGYVTSAEQIRNLRQFLRSYKNVEFFDGFAEAGDSYLEQSLVLQGEPKVYYLTDKKVFACCIDGVYYNNWAYLDVYYSGYDYNFESQQKPGPRGDRIFEDINTGIRYVYNGEDLVEYVNES